MVYQIIIEIFKPYFPWQSVDNILVTVLFWLNLINGFFFFQVERENSKKSRRMQWENTWKGYARSASHSGANGALTPSLQDCSSSYSMFYVLVNEIVWGSHGPDHVWFATFGTTFTLFWKYLTNELGSPEWVLSLQGRKLAVPELTKLRKHRPVATKTLSPAGVEGNTTNLN